MTKNTFNFREAFERQEQIKARYQELADGLEKNKEREDYTEAEKAEIAELKREESILDMKVRANIKTIEIGKGAMSVEEGDQILREAIKNKQPLEVKIKREGVNVSGYANGLASENPFGVTLQDLVTPLYPQTILAAIGAPLLTGLTGNVVWPVVEAFEASIAEEGVELGDTKITRSKLTAHPERIGITIPLTREASIEDGGILKTVITEYVPNAVAKLMNKIMFSNTKVAGATQLVGPFVGKSKNVSTYSTDVPSYKDLISLKTSVTSKDIEAEGLCYVMNQTTAGNLEATPKWDGANAPILEAGKINGVPVFQSSLVPDGVVYFGAFKYAPQGIFGDIDFIVDPYTGASKGLVRYTTNLDYAITVLRQEAFAMLSKSAG